MEKIETYEPEEKQAKEEFEPKELGWIKTIFLCVGMIVLGGGLAFAIIVIGMTPQFLTDQDCLVLQNESFINGTMVGGEYTLAVITNEVVQCKTIPINYANYNYTLVAVECLNLTKFDGGK